MNIEKAKKMITDDHTIINCLFANLDDENNQLDINGIYLIVDDEEVIYVGVVE